MWFLIFFLGISLHATNSKVLIQNPLSEDSEYSAQLEAGGVYISPTKAYRLKFPSPSAHQQLLSQYAAAHEAFLKGEVKQSQDTFRKTFALLTKEDWKREDRSLLLISALRLAQLAPTSESRDEWLQKSMAVGPDIEANPTLFPPPLIERLHHWHKHKALVSQSRNFTWTAWTEVLINGTACTKHDCRYWTDLPEPVRVTFLSNKFIPQTLLLKTSQFKKANPPTQAWVSDPCHHTVSGSHQKFGRESEIFNQNLCKDINIQPAVTDQSIKDPLSLPLSEQKRLDRIYKSPWLWGSAGMIIAVLAWQFTHNQNRDHHQSTSYGY